MEVASQLMTVSDYLANIRVKGSGFPQRWRSKTGGKVELIPRGYDPYKQEMRIELLTSNQHPDATKCGDFNDINTELSFLNVSQDSLKRKSVTEPIIKRIETLTDHPGLDGDRDHLRSRMKNLRIRHIHIDSLRQINDRFAREGMRPLQDVKGEVTKGGERYLMFEEGEIENTVTES